MFLFIFIQRYNILHHLVRARSKYPSHNSFKTANYQYGKWAIKPTENTKVNIS